MNQQMYRSVAPVASPTVRPCLSLVKVTLEWKMKLVFNRFIFTDPALSFVAFNGRLYPFFELRGVNWFCELVVQPTRLVQHT